MSLSSCELVLDGGRLWNVGWRLLELDLRGPMVFIDFRLLEGCLIEARVIFEKSGYW